MKDPLQISVYIDIDGDDRPIEIDFDEEAYWEHRNGPWSPTIRREVLAFEVSELVRAALAKRWKVGEFRKRPPAKQYAAQKYAPRPRARRRAAPDPDPRVRHRPSRHHVRRRPSPLRKYVRFPSGREVPFDELTEPQRNLVDALIAAAAAAPN